MLSKILQISLTLLCVISYSKDNNYKWLVVAVEMGPHVGNLTKLFPWLVMGMAAVKHKEAADSSAFQASPNPTLSPAQKPNVCTHHAHGLPPKYTHRPLQCHFLSMSRRNYKISVSLYIRFM